MLWAFLFGPALAEMEILRPLRRKFVYGLAMFESLLEGRLDPWSFFALRTHDFSFLFPVILLRLEQHILLLFITSCTLVLSIVALLQVDLPIGRRLLFTLSQNSMRHLLIVPPSWLKQRSLPFIILHLLQAIPSHTCLSGLMYQSPRFFDHLLDTLHRPIQFPYIIPHKIDGRSIVILLITRLRLKSIPIVSHGCPLFYY